jgi:hypothetical protein
MSEEENKEKVTNIFAGKWQLSAGFSHVLPVLSECCFDANPQKKMRVRLPDPFNIFYKKSLIIL